jgi:hypothetical protein
MRVELLSTWQTMEPSSVGRSMNEVPEPQQNNGQAILTLSAGRILTVVNQLVFAMSRPVDRRPRKASHVRHSASSSSCEGF